MLWQELEGKLVGSFILEVADVTYGASKKKPKQDGVTSGPGANDDPSELGDHHAKSARDVVTTYANFSYSDQLQFKKSSMEKILKKLVCYSPHVYFLGLVNHS